MEQQLASTQTANELNADRICGTMFISDNLPFLRSLDSESIDLVCIDPPFGKQQTFEGMIDPPLTPAESAEERKLMDRWGIYDAATAYEIGIEWPDQSGMTAKFSDIWDFPRRVAHDWYQRLEHTNPALYLLIESTRYLQDDGIAAYISFMAERMIEIRRVLKPTGNVYLHCDHEANAYLRQMMDAIFGTANFKNEIVWQRSPGRSTGNHWGNTTDFILFYSKSRDYVWKNTYHPSENQNPTRVPLDAAGVRHGKSGQAWQGYNPTEIGRHWAVPRTGQLARWIEENVLPGYPDIEEPHERLDALNDAGLIVWSDSGRPAILRPPEADVGTKINNLWNDINLLSPTAIERTGYPTQKPQALARRIIEASSSPGDIVLDCFAGCAYVPVAAEISGRKWIACDMSPRAWTVIRRQFHKHPDLGIITEGELSGSVESRFENADKLIKVRGPGELPRRTTPIVEQQPIIKSLPRLQFKRKPVETSNEIWQAFVDEWGTACWYCGAEKAADRRELHLDHIKPNKGDGTNDDCFNRALACAPCNSDKSNNLSVEETIDKALKDGRIQTPARRNEVLRGFKSRHEWAKIRWTRIKPNPS